MEMNTYIVGRGTGHSARTEEVRADWFEIRDACLLFFTATEDNKTKFVVAYARHDWSEVRPRG